MAVIKKKIYVESKAGKDALEKPYDRASKLRYLIACMTCLVILDLLTRDQIFQWSLPILKLIREDYSTPQLDQVSKVISELGGQHALTFLIMVAHCTMDQAKSFTFSVTVFASISILGILKSINHEPRPFFVHIIQPSECPLDYGNPSNHSQYSILYLTIVEMLCKSKGWLLGSAVWTLIFLISLSRIYMGVHTLNQILSGLISGLCINMLLCDIFYYEITRFVNQVSKKRFSKVVCNFGTQNFIFLYSIAIAMVIIGMVIYPMPLEQ